MILNGIVSSLFLKCFMESLQFHQICSLMSSSAEQSSTTMSHSRSDHSSQASNMDKAITIEPSEIELEKDANGNFVLLGVGTYGRVRF